MICVTIGRGRHSSLAEEWKAGGRGRRRAGRAADRLPPPRAGPEADPQGAAHAAGLHHPPRRRRRPLARQRGEAPAAAPRGDRRWGSITSTSRWTSPPRSAGSARPSGSSATTTSRARRSTSSDIAEQCEEFDADVVKIATDGHDAGRGLAGPAARRRRQGARRSRSRWARSASSPASSGPSSAPRSPTPASIPSGSSPPGCSRITILKKRLLLRPDRRRDRGLRRASATRSSRA